MEELIGKEVVVDTDTSFIYLGTLEEIQKDSMVLTDVDVHDRHDIETTKEKYILDTRRFGVKHNRKKVYVVRERIVSVSELGDIIKF